MPSLTTSPPTIRESSGTERNQGAFSLSAAPSSGLGASKGGETHNLRPASCPAGRSRPPVGSKESHKITARGRRPATYATLCPHRVAYLLGGSQRGQRQHGKEHQLVVHGEERRSLNRCRTATARALYTAKTAGAYLTGDRSGRIEGGVELGGGARAVTESAPLGRRALDAEVSSHLVRAFPAIPRTVLCHNRVKSNDFYSSIFGRK